MLKRALKFVGFAISVLATVYFFRALLEIKTTLADMDSNIIDTFPETRTIVLRELVDFVEGLGLGLICLHFGTRDTK